MALKIIEATDPIKVERLNVCIYSPPGCGKTSIASTADEPLLLDFDEGVHRSAFRKASVPIKHWSDIEGMEKSDFARFKTVIVDTVGRALDKLTVQIIAANPKMRGYGGALSLQGYGALKSAFVSWIKLLQSYGLDVVMLAHSEEQRSGDSTATRLDIQGGSKNEVYKTADAMGWLYIQDGKRKLNFSPTEATFGTNPGMLPVLDVPDFSKEANFLGVLIEEIKNKLNAGSQAATEEQKIITEWREKFSLAETKDEFNDWIQGIATESPKVKHLLLSVAKSKGLTFDKKSKLFVGAA